MPKKKLQMRDGWVSLHGQLLFPQRIGVSFVFDLWPGGLFPKTLLHVFLVVPEMTLAGHFKIFAVIFILPFL